MRKSISPITANREVAIFLLFNSFVKKKKGRALCILKKKMKEVKVISASGIIKENEGCQVLEYNLK